MQEYTVIKEYFKPRLFVDSDGTFTEWRNIDIPLDENEDAESAAKKLFDILQTPGYFYSLNPNQNVVDAIKMIIDMGEIEVFALTCYPLDGKVASPKKEKDMWFDKYIPEIDSDHRIYVPYGESKNKHIPFGIRRNDVILDDKTSNLKEFEQGGGRGIKLLNNINSTYGTWKGNKVSYTRTPEELAKMITDVVIHKDFVTDKQPPRNVTHFDYETFDFGACFKEKEEEYFSIER